MGQWCNRVFCRIVGNTELSCAGMFVRRPLKNKKAPGAEPGLLLFFRLKAVADRIELVGDLVAQRVHRCDCTHRNERRDQSILDQVLTRIFDQHERDGPHGGAVASSTATHIAPLTGTELA